MANRESRFAVERRRIKMKGIIKKKVQWQREGRTYALMLSILTLFLNSHKPRQNLFSELHSPFPDLDTKLINNAAVLYELIRVFGIVPIDQCL